MTEILQRTMLCHTNKKLHRWKYSPNITLTMMIKNSDNDNGNNTHASGRISTWVQEKGAALFFLPWYNNP
jgi:hypothetical protein